jgi:hypothetical protein
MEDVVDRPQELTPRWLSEALHLAGHDLTVADVAFERVGTGQMGTTYRLHLDYTGPQGPSALIVKMAGEDEASRALVAPGYAAEVGFYTELASALGVRTPRCWYGAITADNERFTLVLDDASPALSGVQARGCTVDEATTALHNLIGLHAPRWNDPTLRDLAFLLRPSGDMAAMMAQVMSTAAEAFVERYADKLSEEDGQTLRDASAVIERWQLARPTPFSVIHGDYRLDNLLFHPVTGAVTAVDWQTAAIGPPLRDVAYFLGTSLKSEARRFSEESLVGTYHRGLMERGVNGYGLDQCWDDYRLGQLQGPMITVIGCVYASTTRTVDSDAMFVAMARRSCAAVRELGSLDLVGS